MWCFESINECQSDFSYAQFYEDGMSVNTQLANTQLIKSRIKESIKKLEVAISTPDNGTTNLSLRKEIQKLKRCLKSVSQRENKLQSFVDVEEAFRDCKKSGFNPHFYIMKGGQTLQQAYEEMNYFLDQSDPLQNLDALYD